MGINRREFLVQSALAGTALTSGAQGAAAAQGATESRARPSLADEVVWLDGEAPGAHEGQTWGMPWPLGTRQRRTKIRLQDSDGNPVPLQSWVTATWPDGSVKWTAHAIASGAGRQAPLRLVPGPPAVPAQPVIATDRGSLVEVRNGPVSWRIGKSGQDIIVSAANGSREVLRNVAFLATVQSDPDDEAGGPIERQRFTSEITAVTVEQNGPVRAVVRVDGRHRGGSRTWLPFATRLYFYAGSEAVRIVHSFVFDGDENRDFIKGLGLTGTVPMSNAPYDRHVRFAGAGDGLWAEAVQPLTGLRRDPGRAFREAQIAGVAVPPVDRMPAQVASQIRFVPQWGDFTLSQLNPDGFTIRKRTKPGHAWIDADAGGRSHGVGYVGGAAGGVAFGIADFWQRYPVQLDVRGAQSDAATFTAWYRSPEGPAMDMRFYHDVMGMGDYADQNEGLDITYEDYEPGWGTPQGIARTTEFMLWALPATPARARFVEMSACVAQPPRLVPRPERIHAAGVFGDWSLPDRSTPARRAIEDQNDFLLDFYRGQIEQRRWYGFWNYGDVMHTYDADRHVWRYDIGGFAWDNSELSTDLWLWYSFLRSGDPKIFRMAEAMTRHTGEVDVYHLGRFRGLGTRHGVQHWGDSSKQPRVSNATYRRIYYYLTADERVGDLMRELLEGDHTLLHVDIYRKVGARRPGSQAEPGAGAPVIRPLLPPGQVLMQFGTVWCPLVAAWLTEWERTGDTRWRDRIVAGMTSIAALPKQWYAGEAAFDVATGRFVGPGDRVNFSHLNAVFGAVEINSELFQLLPLPAYEKAWLDYCTAYNAAPAEFTALTGAAATKLNLEEGHSRLTAFAARRRNDGALARRAWKEFLSGHAGLGMGVSRMHRQIAGPDVLKPVDEDPRISTNAAAQWGLAAIQNLALVGGALDQAFEASAG